MSVSVTSVNSVNLDSHFAPHRSQPHFDGGYLGFSFGPKDYDISQDTSAICSSGLKVQLKELTHAFCSHYNSIVRNSKGFRGLFLWIYKGTTYSYEIFNATWTWSTMPPIYNDFKKGQSVRDSVERRLRVGEVYRSFIEGHSTVFLAYKRRNKYVSSWFLFFCNWWNTTNFDQATGNIYNINTLRHCSVRFYASVDNLSRNQLYTETISKVKFH